MLSLALTLFNMRVSSSTDSFVLREDGSFVLREDGSKILRE